jgi:alkylation response protein AidB-like acyl-CoA dehydrogenase
VNFAPDPGGEETRADVRRFLEQALTVEIRERASETGTMHDWEFHRQLARMRWICPHWTVEKGGFGASVAQHDAIVTELKRAGAPNLGMAISQIVLDVVAVEPSETVRREIIPSVIAGDAVFSMGYSEPGSGSDVAAARTLAKRRGADWVIEGQKAFTSLAHEASWVFLLARTAPDAPKHDGLTMFLVPTSSRGFSLDPVWTLGGERTNMTYYDGVVVSDDHRVGAVGGGWNVLLRSLASERRNSWSADLLQLVDTACAWASRIDRMDAAVEQALGQLLVDAEVARLLGLRALHSPPGPTRPEHAMAKLYASEALVRHASTLMDIGGHPLLRRIETNNSLLSTPEEILRHAHVTTLVGGCSEVLLDLIARRGLGLTTPRVPPSVATR